MNQYFIFRQWRNTGLNINEDEYEDVQIYEEEELGSKEFTQRIKVGFVNKEKKCVKTQTRYCKGEKFGPENVPFIPKGHCTLPVDLGCSGTYK